MIWFFLAGMIAGAVGMMMLATWWVRTHAKRVTLEEMKEEIEQMKEDNNNHD